MSSIQEKISKPIPNQGKQSSGENIKVVVRCRPLSKKEIESGFKSTIQIEHERGQVNVIHPSKEIVKQFTFDLVFDQIAPQLDVYNRAARPIVDNVLEGYNGTIFAYGQTGTGKTYTMEGNHNIPEYRGITPNTFSHIFSYIAKAEENKKFLVRASYLEIYNEEVRDLLGKNLASTLEVKERPDIGVYVKGLSTFMVHQPDDLDRIMSIGNKNRVVGATHMNLHSSRSHVIFTITIECSEPGIDGQDHVRVGKLNLVDLAGSERQVKTKSTGQRLREASKINLSLSTLGNVISALVDGKSSHIPYRNSKLTRLLQDSLGGNAKTLMCANIGPAEYNLEETLSTLRFASRAKNIKNKARINEDPKDAVLRQLQKEIEELRKRVRAEEEGEDDNESSSGEDENGVGSGDEIEGEEGKVRKKRHKKKTLSKEQMEAIKEKIDEDRKNLIEQKGLAEEEKNRLVDELKMREDELSKAQADYKLLMEKLESLEKKIIVGGENLLQKAELQERLLEESAKELEENRKTEVELQKKLKQKEAERVNFEEKYTGLREEISGKTKKIKKVMHMLVNARSELSEAQQEHQRELEEILENVRLMSRELQLATRIIETAIPNQYQELIEKNIFWNEEIGDWQLKCVAYAGNNMHPEEPQHTLAKDKKRQQKAQLDLSPVYFVYSHEGAELVLRQKLNSNKIKSSKPKKKRRMPLGSFEHDHLNIV